MHVQPLDAKAVLVRQIRHFEIDRTVDPLCFAEEQSGRVG
jgi:hypothetical protein